MTSKTWIARSKVIEAPVVEDVNLQVRTGMSVPFAPHMLGAAEAPSAEAVNLQVRTGMSVPFASYMIDEKPEQTKTSQSKA